MSIEWRDATAADAAALALLGRATFVDTFGRLYSPEDLALFLANHDVDRWATQLADPAFAVRIGAVADEAIAYAKLGPPKLPFATTEGATELKQFYVSAAHQGSGAAQAMMNWVLAEARQRGGKDLYLSVFIDNHRARRFYAKYGFVDVGPYTFMVGTHADQDVVMRLTL
jgi:GNAT superfamily N-acetyltransferase